VGYGGGKEGGVVNWVGEAAVMGSGEGPGSRITVRIDVWLVYVDVSCVPL
jgi:hypothetical protein